LKNPFILYDIEINSNIIGQQLEMAIKNKEKKKRKELGPDLST
jgi:hypothetical protein